MPTIATADRIYKGSQLVYQKAAGGAPVVVGFGDCPFVTATSVTATVPQAAQAGDMLLAFVMHRAALTVPSGWELIDTVLSNGYPQHTSCLRKTYEGETSVEFTQASSVRIAVHVMVVRGVAVEVTGTADGTGAPIDGVVPLPSAERAPAQLLIAAASWVFATTGATNSAAISAGWQQTTPFTSSDRANQIRMACGYCYRDGTSGGAVTINTAGDNSYTSMIVRVS